MIQVMDAMMLATGFTGALTLLWLVRLILHAFRPPSAVAVHFAPAGDFVKVCIDEIASTRREVLLIAGRLCCRPIAQALVDARLRGATVEILLDPSSETDPSSDLHFLVEQGLTPALAPKRGLAHQTILLDGKTALVAGFPLVQDGDQAGALLVVRGQPELIRTYHQEYAVLRGGTRASTAQPDPTPETPTPVPTPPPAAEAKKKAEKVPVPAPVSPPSSPPLQPEDVLTAVAQQLTVTQPEEPPVNEEMAALVTPAAAELFARLRKQISEDGEPGDKLEGKRKKAG